MGHKVVLTPEQLHRLLGLPDGVDVREVSLSQRPPGVHVKLSGEVPADWELPAAVLDCPRWRPASPVVPLVGSIRAAPTCANGDHEWPPPSGDGPWITGDGMWHRWDKGAQVWVHDESVEVGALFDVSTGGPV